ncbi:SMC-Scp complex subunit ScpB [Tuberibacillus sp. Marseille-P3662]|uniref:SMC-Scp complex subunit ScpB n=1 Tax=Tuberibacillus sp. Marseille-P3662 TaxID=1965358 RepID=UPI001592D24F|nr:SMC-Scp complex subunit ScpB [Tuberibacillus sp. Marseille-P3662]
MNNEKLAALEAMLYLAGNDGLTEQQIQTALAEDDVEHVIQAFNDLLNRDDRGLELQEIAGTYQLITKTQLSPYIEKMVQAPRPSTLSQAALETLAIIAYNQPISRAEVEEIRGVKSEKAIHTLVSRDLVKEVGRAEGTGRAILYGVTDEFLTYFGLRSLDDLPPMPSDETLDNEHDSDLFFEKFQQTIDDL